MKREDWLNELSVYWQEVFNDGGEWIESFIHRVNADDILIDAEQHLQASMFLLPYNLHYSSAYLKGRYIYGAMTVPLQRHKGLMSQLMLKAIKRSKLLDEAFISLIPASRDLFFFYDRFDFATTFYIEQQRYTGVHKFPYNNRLQEIKDADINMLYEFFNTMEKRIPGRLLHSFDDFLTIKWDLEYSCGKIIVVGDGSEIKGIAFCVPNNNEVVVKEILLEGYSVEEILYFVRKNFMEQEITIERTYSFDTVNLQSRGMLRIINVYKFMESIAVQHPELYLTIKIHDPLIDDNNHIFILEDGKVVINDSYSGRIENDLDIKTLAEVLFSTPANGELFGLPTQRGSMALMLE